MSEDIYVDELWMNFIENNFSYVKALFPRIYVDVNRHPLELDQKMFSSLIAKGFSFGSSSVVFSFMK